MGSAASLNIHLHCLVLDGVYRGGGDGVPAFVEVAAPTDDELHALLQTLITRHAAVRVEAHDRKQLDPDTRVEPPSNTECPRRRTDHPKPPPHQRTVSDPDQRSQSPLVEAFIHSSQGLFALCAVAQTREPVLPRLECPPIRSSGAAPAR
jgi:hypothetical protein